MASPFETEADDGESHGRSAATANRVSRPSRRQLLGATTGALGTSLAGCLDGIRGTADDADEVRIGVLVGGTGQAQTNAAKVAAREFNEDGGINGRDVTVVAAETDSSPLEARRSYHRLVLEEDVDVTMGISATPVLDHLVEDFAEQQLLHFTTGSGSLTPTRLVERDYETYKYHFRTGPINDEQLVENQFEFIRQMGPQLGWDSIGFLSERYPWTEGVNATLERRLSPLGFEVPYSHRYPPAIDDFGSIYDDLEEAGVDVVWVGMGHTGDHAVAQWARERRPFEFGGTHIRMQFPSYWDKLDGASRYTFAQTAATPTSELTTKTDDFVTAFDELTGGDKPVYTSYNTYDSILAYKTAVENAGTFDTDAVIAELESLRIEGTTGTISYDGAKGEYPHDRKFDPRNDKHDGSVFFQWRDGDGSGRQEVIWPDHYATADYVAPPWIESV